MHSGSASFGAEKGDDNVVQRGSTINMIHTQRFCMGARAEWRMRRGAVLVGAKNGECRSLMWAMLFGVEHVSWLSVGWRSDRRMCRGSIWGWR